jgi:hypothetical protein
MNELLEAPEQMARARSEEPRIYQAGDCWRFSWAGEDRGSFDSEQDARSAALRLKQQTMLKHVAASLRLR